MTVLYLRDLSDSLEVLGETIDMELQPRAFKAAQREAGPMLVWIEAGTFRFRQITIRAMPRPTSAPPQEPK